MIMEENTEEEKVNVEQPDGEFDLPPADDTPPEDLSEPLTDKERLDRARLLIRRGELDEAQKMLDAVKEKSGKKYFIQSKLFEKKGWLNEQRKQLQAAVKADPDNEEYRAKLAELEELRKNHGYKTVKGQMGDKDGFMEACCLCSCEVCGSGLCESICDGCS